MHYFQVYTIAEELHKGQYEQIGANGLKILHYQIQDDTSHIGSEESQQELSKIIHEEKQIFGLTSDLLMQ